MKLNNKYHIYFEKSTFDILIRLVKFVEKSLANITLFYYSNTADIESSIMFGIK